MIASAAASWSIAAWSSRRGTPATAARAMSTASGRELDHASTVAVTSSSRSTLEALLRRSGRRACASRTGWPVPALTTTRRCIMVERFRSEFAERAAARAARRSRCGSSLCATCRPCAPADAALRGARRPSVRRMRQARASSGSATRSHEPAASSRATRRDMPGWVSSTSSPSSVIRRPSGARGQRVEHAVLARRRAPPRRPRRRARWAIVACARNSASHASFAMRVGSPCVSATSGRSATSAGSAVLVGRRSR